MTFAIGQTLTAAGLDSITTASVQFFSISSNTTNSTTYVALIPAPGGTFVAPGSGKVWIHIAAEVGQNASGTVSWMSFEVREGAVLGSGTIVTAASDARAIAAGGPSECRPGRTCLVTGLTPGSTYNVRAMCRGNIANNARFSGRRVCVMRA